MPEPAVMPPIVLFTASLMNTPSFVLPTTAVLVKPIQFPSIWFAEAVVPKISTPLPPLDATTLRAAAVGPADRVILGPLNRHARRGVARGQSVVGNPDQVAFHQIARGTRAECVADSDAVAGVAGDHVFGLRR